MNLDIAMQRMMKHLFTATLFRGVFALSAQSPASVSLKGRLFIAELRDITFGIALFP